ncbi:NAD-dependent epimerase/dehydratase family protein [Deinococcus humi]|uniref:Nucleoside-diphosphate-sugar epimerase n=1 Tax=Deinococcus humi TaxID=662880 RepID=A0A7W8NE65_9DEIO|nr:NAD-dependent epimerase/dehydratase family protein [Deinococcus humi]MBB5361483.1 nucleoside-diphosphate-sugar epimerase [Deinococcus humi]GGO20302.1 snoG protein [Deinococcus humi]
MPGAGLFALSLSGPVLVLGARGFLGTQIVADLRAAGQTVRVTPPGDLTSATRADWDGFLGEVSGVINAAGRTVGTPGELTRANALLPARVLEEVARVNVKLVHLASAAEYGAVPEGHASHEDDPARPLSPYGASKLAGTVLIEEAVRSGRVQAVALRVTNPLGAGIGAGTLPGRAARELAQAARDGQDTVRFGPLGARRDFVDARDAARAALHALTSDLSGVVNVGSGEARPVRDLVDGLVTLTGFRGQILEDAPGSPRSGDVPYQRADVSRLLDSGFTLQYRFRDSLAALLCELHPAGERSAVLG